jgi:hypothetical protein
MFVTGTHGAAQLAFLRRFDWPDSDMAIATACFRLLTFRPDPLLSFPLLYSCMTFLTFPFCAVLGIGIASKGLSDKRGCAPAGHRQLDRWHQYWSILFL